MCFEFRREMRRLLYIFVVVSALACSKYEGDRPVETFWFGEVRSGVDALPVEGAFVLFETAISDVWTHNGVHRINFGEVTTNHDGYYEHRFEHSGHAATSVNIGQHRLFAGRHPDSLSLVGHFVPGRINHINITLP